MDGVELKKTGLVAIVVALLMVAPATVADHDPAPEGEEDALDALTRMGTDGYVVVVERVANQVFRVQVLHEGSFGLGGEPAKLLPDAAFDDAGTDTIVVEEDTTNRGLWLHDVNGFEVGQRPLQSLTFTRNAAGEQSMLVEILPATEGLRSIVAIAPVLVENSTATSWAGGFYNPVKTYVPLDIFDAVPYPVNLHPNGPL